MSDAPRLKALEASGLLHPNAELVSSSLFAEDGFFLTHDKVQVKYEMLRAHAVDGRSVSAASAAHGYSRSAFYLVRASFARAGMTGLLDGRPVGTARSRSPRTSRPSSGRHPRASRGRSWPARWHESSGCCCTGARWNGSSGHDHAVGAGLVPSSLAAARFARRGLAGLISWPAGETDFRAELSGARRPAWTPHHDPRMDALAAVFSVLLEAADRLDLGNDQTWRWVR